MVYIVELSLETNSLYSFLDSSSFSISDGFLFFLLNSFGKGFIQFLIQLLLNLCVWICAAAKLFRVLCYARITLEWFPMINPYVMPYALIKQVTDGYFNYWNKIIPKIRMRKRAYNVSVIICIELLNTLTYFLVLLINLCIFGLETISVQNM
jgi:uncharacterized protein YggT (Ycf19 family)